MNLTEDRNHRMQTPSRTTSQAEVGIVSKRGEKSLRVAMEVGGAVEESTEESTVLGRKQHVVCMEN